MKYDNKELLVAPETGKTMSKAVAPATKVDLEKFASGSPGYREAKQAGDAAGCELTQEPKGGVQRVVLVFDAAVGGAARMLTPKAREAKKKA